MTVNIDAANKAEYAYHKIEKLIVFRELTPGSMISEKQLCERLDLGRTPVREALQRLSYEGMVEIHPRRGIMVPMISLETQLKILEVRRDIEALCVKFAAMRASEAQKKRMVEMGKELIECANNQDDHQFAELLKNIHLILVEAANNEYLQLAIIPLQGLSRRFWFAYKNQNSDLKMAARCHSKILKHIVYADALGAIQAAYELNDYLSHMAHNTVKMSPKTF
ncbi:GntR family transcriptional regulator [Shewanella marina]|uniref:GntR family transcriptional regulator n=1 Tax=Shewanella marina TaxID=487319 RepID=UPI0004701A92|nr:GntR family transcriptional regulator [Shewanella marina]